MSRTWNTKREWREQNEIEADEAEARRSARIAHQMRLEARLEKRMQTERVLLDAFPRS